MDFRRWWQRAAKLMRVAPLVFGLAPFQTTAMISAQEATPGAGTACQHVIEHDVAAQTQRLLADCVTDETIFVSNGWTFDGGGHTIFAVDPAGWRLQAAVLSVKAGAGSVHDVVIDGRGLEEPCLIDGGATALGGLVFLDSTGEARRVTVRNMDRDLPPGEDAFADGQSQMESCGTGIAVIGEHAQVAVAASVVSGVGYAGVLIEHGAATISNNVIVRAADAGVLALLGAHVRVTPGNQISYGSTGIFFEGEGTSGRIAGNTIVQMRNHGVVVMAGAHASLADNLITDATERGVVVLQGATAVSDSDEVARTSLAFSVMSGELAVNEPVISACRVGVLSVDGSAAEVKGGEVRECAYGLGASGAGSRLVASEAVITGAASAGVTSEAGGHVELHDLSITHSLDGMTVLGESSALVASTQVKDTTEAALWIEGGGKAIVSDMEIARPGIYGARIMGPGSTLTLSNSTISGARDVSIQAIAGARFTGRSLRVTAAETGLLFRDIDTTADLTGVAVSGGQTHLVIEEGAQATVTRLSSAGGKSGVQVRGPGARATIRESSIAHLAYEGVQIRDGGWASVATTQFSEAGETAIQIENTAPLFVPAAVTIGDEGCTPGMISAPAETRVRITFHNATRSPREIAGPVLTARERLAPGEQVSLNITGPAGDLTFSCFPPDGVGAAQPVVVRFVPAGQPLPPTIGGEPILLRANAFSDGRTGISISGPHRAVISENTMNRLRGDGIALSDGATATVRDNVLVDLGEAGILVEDGAQAMVTGNSITNTRTWGIRVYGAESSGTVARNVIRDAGLAGIEVSHAARATLLQNELPANDTHGILIQGASAAVWQNSIGPAQTGIAVTNGAVATISRNQVSQVSGTGLVIANAQAVAAENTFVGLGLTGTSEAEPATGIHLLADASGTLRGNTVSGFLTAGSCGLLLSAPTPAALRIDDMSFPAPGNWRDRCVATEPAATPVPAA
ncbi:MAG: right-handed parallel beta-helix repeat-containing protein [Thermomicrobiales bacterium]|nr:right-handed parallel beta-helix repeat-containing protein [Thermomicrobiales bacterium]